MNYENRAIALLIVVMLIVHYLKFVKKVVLSLNVPFVEIFEKQNKYILNVHVQIKKVNKYKKRI